MRPVIKIKVKDTMTLLLLCLLRHRSQASQSGKYLQVNTLRPEQNWRHFADDIFKGIFLNENVLIPIKIALRFVSKGPINNIPALV